MQTTLVPLQISCDWVSNDSFPQPAKPPREITKAPGARGRSSASFPAGSTFPPLIKDRAIGGSDKLFSPRERAPRTEQTPPASFKVNRTSAIATIQRIGRRNDSDIGGVRRSYEHSALPCSSFTRSLHRLCKSRGNPVEERAARAADGRRSCSERR